MTAMSRNRMLPDAGSGSIRVIPGHVVQIALHEGLCVYSLGLPVYGGAVFPVHKK